MLNRAIACPVEWCAGSLIDHGGAGDEPEHWLHSDGNGIEIAAGWMLCRSQMATGPIRWHLFNQTDEVVTASDRQGLADQLRHLAHVIEETAQ